jgi:hypothetical protein
MARDQVSTFFKECLDIPFEAKRDEISTRKANQFDALKSAYATSVREGAEDGTVWASLQAITRYVDHERSTRGGSEESAFHSAQFGSGASLKDKAMGLLLPRIKDKVPVAA